MNNYCLHPIEFTTLYDWYIQDDDRLIVIGKCGLCGSDSNIIVIRDQELIFKRDQPINT